MQRLGHEGVHPALHELGGAQLDSGTDRREAPGRAVLLSSHLLDDVSTLCDRVVILHRGRVIASDRPANLAPRLAVRSPVDVLARAPAVALRAYADASLTIGVEQPGCRLGWSTLAAIGGIESGHGTHGGGVLREDGTTTDPILGPALDGRAGFAAIRATPESTAWHGDATWDHAVGPMQMLPSTWSRWRADGDGDGVDDPNDIDDAALGAARYLCASGADLTGATGWHDAVFSYNHSEQYVADVLGAANRYAAGSLAG